MGCLELGRVLRLRHMTAEDRLSHEEIYFRMQRMRVRHLEHAEPATAVGDRPCYLLVGWFLCLFIWRTWISFLPVIMLVPQGT